MEFVRIEGASRRVSRLLLMDTVEGEASLSLNEWDAQEANDYPIEGNRAKGGKGPECFLGVGS